MSGPYKRMIGTVLQRLRVRIENAESIIIKDEIDDEEKESLLNDGKGIQKILKTLDEKNKLWLDFLKDLDPDDRIKETQAYENYTVENRHFYEWIEKGREIVDSIDELVLQRNPDTSENNSVVTQTNNVETRELTVQLPRLQLPEFHGDPHHWISFWQSFESSIDRHNFSQIDKMKFLLNCLKGEARNVVSDLMLTNENYQIAVNTLKERFGDKNILIEALESELFRLPTCTEKSISLKYTVDKVEKIFRQLESIEPWNPMLMVLKVKVFSPRNEDKKTEIFVFLDSGSEVSYITDELTKKLNLPKLGEGFLEVYTFQGNKSEKQQSGKYLLGIERKDGKNEMIELLSINKIANELRS
uniref:Peptidase aspartic putative domain-containing protein n=1 Tax=Meloidogyne javanica TaxID=6303 RepID=A0A915MC04_MELJA